MSRAFKFIVTLCLLNCSTISYSIENFRSSTVTLTGEEIIGGEAGETITNVSQFFAASIHGNGVYFQSATSNGDTVVSDGASVVLRTNTQIPGAAPGTSAFLLGYTPFDGGVYLPTVFNGSAVDSTNDGGLLLHEDGTTELCTQRGDPAPGTSDIYGYFGSLRADSMGNLSHSTGLQNSGENAHYYGNCDDGFELVEKTGTVVGDETTTSVNTVTINSSRRVALYARKWTSTATQLQRSEVVGRLSDGSKHILLASGMNGFSLPTGTSIAQLTLAKVNELDQFVAFTEYEGASTGTSIHQFQLEEIAAALEVTSGRSVAKTGDATPGLVDSQFDFFSNFLQNASGDVALVAEASSMALPLNENGPQAVGTSVQGVWYEDGSGTLQLGAYNGMQAPGLDPGATIQQVQFPAFNDLNQVAFKSSLVGPGVDFSSDKALWATDRNGDLQLVARTGDLFDVDDDPEVEDFRTINAIGALENSAGTGGQQTSLSDDGRLAMMLSFSDSTSGIFVFDLSGSSPADLNGDGFVDGLDLGILLGNFEQTADPSGGELNGTPPVDGLDLGILLGAWNPPAAPASVRSVPEPSSHLLSLFALVVVWQHVPLRR